MYHESGLAQKLVIGAAHRPETLTLLYAFLIKLNLFKMRMQQGVLGGMAKP